jgi:ribosomal protein S18 acetylase RimI-like enzyme
MAILVTPVVGGEVDELAAVAAATFPLACPESVPEGDIAAFIAANLSAERFTEYLADPGRLVLKATEEGRIIGYAMLIREADHVDLSKMYVLPEHHHGGAAAALMDSGIAWSVATGAAEVRLGVNQNNARAQRFYGKHGFEVIGTRTFRLGAGTQSDFVMGRPL